jgi:hypothetical protein
VQPLSEKVKRSKLLIKGKVTRRMSEVNIATIQLLGEKQSFILNKKDFKTGSRGFHGTGKMVAGGKKLSS